MLGRVIPWLAVIGVASALAQSACNPPILLEAKTGWQPRSDRYVVRYLDEPLRAEPLPQTWALIDRREIHSALRPATSASSYDMVFFERIAGGDYRGGSALYVWTDEPGGSGGSGRSAQQIASALVAQGGNAPLVKLLPGAPDRGCPCTAEITRQNEINKADLAGVEMFGAHRVGGDAGDRYGFYLAVVHNPKAPADDDAHVIVLFIAPAARFPGLLVDASALVRRIRWE